VSTPLKWEEVAECNPADHTVFTVPKRFAAIGDPHAAMDEAPGSIEGLLALAERDDAAGLGDAPWPPHFAKQEGEAPRVMPSRAKTPGAKRGGGARVPKMPLITIANSPKKDEALAGLDDALTVRASLDAVGDPCRDILDRFFCRDESYKAIGDALGLPAGTIASRISRCLGKVRAELEGRT